MPPARTATAAIARIIRRAPLMGLWLVCAVFSHMGTAPTLRAEPVRVIVDTDMMTDCDDAGALALLHVLADQGEVEILGTVVCTLNQWSAPCVDAINTYYGRPHLPLGTLKGSDGVNISSLFAQGVAQNFPQDTGTGGSAENALAVLRHLLANESGKDVVIITLGYMTNLANLMNSPADAISPLTGAQLIDQKVKAWICMGGNFPNDDSLTSESDNVNFRRHPASVIDCVTNWPGRIDFVGREIGHAMRAGARLNQTPSTNPVRRAYELYFGGSVADRHCADIVAILYGARGLSNYWTQDDTGSVVFSNANAWFKWLDPPDASNQLYIKQMMSPTTIQEHMEDLMLYAPGSGQAAPTAAVTAPVAGARFGAGEIFNIFASATDANGTIAKVEFFDGLRKIGERVSAPFTLPYSTAVEGSHRLTVKVTDNEFKSTISAAVTLEIGDQPPPAGTGLVGEYYNNIDFTGLITTHTDATVNFNWAAAAPAAGMEADSFSVRWTGAVLPPHSSGSVPYTFYTNTNDGVRLWVDDVLVIDNWVAGPLRENSAVVNLAAATLHTLKMEFFENTNNAQAELYWASSTAGLTRQIIPQTRLYPQPNQSPVAMDDAATADMEVAVLIPVLDNDSDPDGVPLSLAIQSASGGVPGSSVVIVGHQLRYTPAPGFTGPDSLTYVVSDGQSTDTGMVTLHVMPWAEYAAFKRRYFTTAEQGTESISGWSADPDGDGVSNGVEYSLFTDPRTALNTPPASAQLRDGQLVLTYHRRKAASDLVYVPAVTANFVDWDEGPSHIEQIVVSEDALKETVEARDLAPYAGGSRFMKLVVTPAMAE